MALITQAAVTLGGVPLPPASAPPGAATWVSLSANTISSLDTGRVSYVTAWGGSEFGYAYTYALSGAPGGVTIDGDMGILSVGTPLAAGPYTFNVIATNRENTSLSAGLPVTLTVRQGVTSGRTGTQILHKTYDPHSGTWGTPSGNNWTNVLLNIQSAIQADQVTNGEEQLRAVIPFHRGATYQYTNNHWLDGIQYYDVTATGSGAPPILQNNGSGTSYEGGPLNIGSGGALNHQGSIKSFCATLGSVAAGSTAITCATHAQASRVVPGRWHAIMGSAIQIGGYPANTMFIDFVRPLAVNASTGVITLDRPLKYGYSSSWWEDFSDDNSFGRGWIVPWDTGGSGGLIPADLRIAIRGRFYNINFQPNPNGSTPSLIGVHIQCDFDGCTVQNAQVSGGKHYAFFNCTMQNGSEPDKLAETLFMDNTTADRVGGATGYSYFLARNCTFRSTVTPLVQISPRQFRALGCTFDCQSNAFPPFTYSTNGPDWYDDFQSCIFTSTVNTPWTFAGGLDSSNSLTIGTDATWSGNQLRIPRGFANFEHWLIYSYAGGIISVAGVGPVTSNWGYISSTTSDGLSNGALWLNVVWVNGTKPTSGVINIGPSQGRRLNMTNPSFTGSVTYADPKFTKQTVTGQTSWGFPAGYPIAYQ